MDRTTPAPRRRIPAEQLPDLARPVALFGSAGRSEVGGSICFGAVVAAAVYASHG